MVGNLIPNQTEKSLAEISEQIEKVNTIAGKIAKTQE
ncbi:MAG: hypothetical protein PWP62_2141 [Eubacteriaceae bacterium]|jgi:hypothetical protein|nr:hypothetical protein [Eubacteriaceae bacterium]